MLDLLGRTPLTAPTPSQLPPVRELWRNSWALAVACYSLLVVVAGVLVMTHQSVQTRYSLRSIAPRIPLGFLAAALSPIVAQRAIEPANALLRADGSRDSTARAATSHEDVIPPKRFAQISTPPRDIVAHVFRAVRRQPPRTDPRHIVGSDRRTQPLFLHDDSG